MDGGQVGDTLQPCDQRDGSINNRSYKIDGNWLLLRAVDAFQRVSQILRKVRGVLSMFGRLDCLLMPRGRRAFAGAQGDAPNITSLTAL